MAFDYAGTAREVYSDLKDAGGPVAIVIESAGTYDENTSRVTATSTTYNTVGVMMEYSMRSAGFRAADGTTAIQYGDRQLLMAAVDNSGAAIPLPPENSRVTAPDGATYAAVTLKPLAPAGLPILYEIQLRR